MNQPSIGAIVCITNPRSTGYLSYLACVDSWSKVVDQLVIVDGWSDDGSLELLAKWIGHRPNVQIVSNPATLWGQNNDFHAAQQNVAFAEGIAALDTHWVLAVQGDHVAEEDSAKGIRAKLGRLSNQVTACFDRYRLDYHGRAWRVDAKGIAVNSWLLREQGVTWGWGETSDTGLLSDLPIAAKEHSHFEDPVNRHTKRHLKGDLLPRGPNIGLRFTVNGYRFMTAEQVLSAARRWDNAMSRYEGKVPLSDRAIWTVKLLDKYEDPLPRDKAIARMPNPELKRVVAEFYERGMLGGMANSMTAAGPRIPFHHRAYRRLAQAFVRARGYPSIRKNTNWSPIGASLQKPPLRVREVYERQDRFLTPALTIRPDYRRA